MLLKLSYSRIYIFICEVFFTLLTMQVYSQKDTVQLKEVEVFGIRPEISTTTPSPVQQMTTKKIQAIPSASVAEAIRNFSGVVLKDYGGVGGLKTVMIRSMGSNHTTVFVDGQPSGDATTGQIDIGKFSLQDVNDIKLSVGQPEFGLFPARIYSSASVITINSREPDFSDQNYLLSLSTRAGSFGTINPTIRFDSKLSDHTSGSVRFNYFTTNGRYPYQIRNGGFITETNRSNSDVETFDASLRAKIVFSDSSRLFIKTSYYNSDRGLPGAVILYNPYSSQRLVNRDIFSHINYERSLSNNAQMLVSTGFSDLYILYTDPSFLNQSGGISNEYRQQEYFFSDAVSIKASPSLQFSGATDIIINALNSNAYSINDPLRLTSLTALSFQFKAPLNIEMQGNILFTAASDRRDNIHNRSYHRLSPAISLLRKITSDESLKIRFMYKSIYRMPSFNDLYFKLAGNSDLKPEKASLYNLGILYSKSINQKSVINIRLDGFTNKVLDKIVAVPTQNLFVWSTQNIGKAQIRGIEFFAGTAKILNHKWSVDLSGTYTYQNAKDISNRSDDKYGDQLAYIPYETAGGLFTLYFMNTAFSLNTLYNGFRYSSGSNNNENILSSWITSDITIAWQKTINNHSYSIKLESSNVFNEKYEIVRNFPMTGRAFYINLNVTL